MTIKSQALRDSAGHHDARCFLNIAGTCPDETESKVAGNVLCHIRLPGEVGGAQKPDDFCASFGCGPCHTVFDANGTGSSGLMRGSEEWLFYAIRGMVRTQRWWVEHGYLTVKGVK